MIIRQANWLGQQRVDGPHLRALESSAAADFDILAGDVLSGGEALVIKGFNVITTGIVGSQASGIQVQVAGGIVLHQNASESGTIFAVPAGKAPEVMGSTNPLVSGSFTASQTNYVGLDLRRTADETTSDNVQFYDPDSKQETSKTVPLARTLNYRFVISTADFSSQPNVLPIAQVVTDSSNNVVSFVDARQLAFRLGSGGDLPNSKHAYPWPSTRVENISGDVFSGGDKVIGSFKEWMDAAMTRMWEIGGGEYWYSPTADRNVRMGRIPSPVFSSTGDNFEFVSSNLHWQGLRVLFDNSTGSGVYYNTVQDQLTSSAGLTDLTPGQCLYVDVVRGSAATLVAVKGTLQTLGTPTVPGSRFVLAWANSDGSISVRDTPLPVNSGIIPATTVAVGGVRLAYAAGTPSTPTTPPLDANNAISIGTGGYAISGNNVGLTVVGGGTAAGASFTAGSGSDVAVTCNSDRISSVKDPISAQDVVTKNFLDNRTGPTNLIMNGGFELAQRYAGPAGVNITPALSPTFGWDRWLCAAQGSTQILFNADTSSSFTPPQFPTGAALMSVSGSASGSPCGVLYQEIDRDFLTENQGRTFTLSAYVRAGLAGASNVTAYVIAAVSGTTGRIQNFPSSGTAPNGYASGSTTLLTTTVLAGPGSITSITHMNLGSVTIPANVTAMCVMFVMQATNVSDFFTVVGVQLNPGTAVLTPHQYVGGTKSTELVECMRYYEKSYDANVALGTTGGSTGEWGLIAAATLGNVIPVPQAKFKVAKRAIGTATIYSWGTGTVNKYYVDGTDATAAIGAPGLNEITNETSSAQTPGTLVRYHWTVDAEI